MTYELITFDYDGVLIDSELLANRSEVGFLQSFGIEYSSRHRVQAGVKSGMKDDKYKTRNNQRWVLLRLVSSTSIHHQAMALLALRR